MSFRVKASSLTVRFLLLSLHHVETSGLQNKSLSPLTTQRPVSFKMTASLPLTTQRPGLSGRQEPRTGGAAHRGGAADAQ